MLEEGMLSFALLGAEWVLWLLVGLSIASFAIAVERAIYLSRSGSPAAPLGAALQAYEDSGDASTFRTALESVGGMEATVLASGMSAVARGPEAVEKRMTGTAKAEKLRMEKRLSFLATVGANAPFIGLFGTVLGIMKAFRDLAEAGEGNTDAVMAGISEALVATAVGLAVAIPAVVLYNAFSRAVKARLGRAESLADHVLARLDPVRTEA